jgi:hypothetical protein
MSAKCCRKRTFMKATTMSALRQQRASAEVGIAPHDGDERSSPRSVRGGSPARSDGRKSIGKA